ncbi:MAG: SDR family NAD(P)-dependent oxidoreductase [Actinomycetota bacterium]|nr:SDR family NAD(P)-dependent oxidoreductase [Actinomycetota bacterium]
MKLHGKSVLVTGAASGIGRAIARRVANEGPSVVVCVDKNESGASAVSNEIAAAGTPSYSVAVDLADREAIELLASVVTERSGGTDVLFANAGVSFGGGLDTLEEAWQTSWEVNVMAQVRLARSFLPGMIERGGGYIVNTASAAGLLTNLGGLSYSVTKHGSVALSEWMAITHARDNIKVSVLCPMGVRTNMLFPEEGRQNEEHRLAQAAVLEAGDVLEPEVVADKVLEAMDAEQFLILPHESVRGFYSFRANDTDKWIASMARYQQRLGGA